MARSNLGGSRRKLSGQLGSNIYETQRDAEGRLQQVVYAKPEGRAWTLTPAAATQRMIMSVIMRHMTLLQPFMRICSEWFPEGTMCVQEFVRMNVEPLRAIVEDDPDSHRFVWWPLYGDTQVFPASIRLTEGNWTARTSFASSYSVQGETISVQMEIGIARPGDTWRDFCTRNLWWPGGYGFKLFFIMAHDGEPSKYIWVRFRIREDIDLDSPFYAYNWGEQYQWDGDVTIASWSNYVRPDGGIVIYATTAYMRDLFFANGETELAMATIDGKRKITTCSIIPDFENRTSDLIPHTFTDAFQTWYYDRINNQEEE